jgi:hypothetical protein
MLNRQLYLYISLDFNIARKKAKFLLRNKMERVDCDAEQRTTMYQETLELALMGFYESLI